MANEISDVTRQYLVYCGISARAIAKCNMETRLYHDLGIYGDIAESCMEILEEKYNVDMNKFEFERFFPHEFPWRNPFMGAVLSLLPFANLAARQGREYDPLTLGMIEVAMRTGQIGRAKCRASQRSASI